MQETARIEEREISKKAERHEVHNSSLLSKLPSPLGLSASTVSNHGRMRAGTAFDPEAQKCVFDC